MMKYKVTREGVHTRVYAVVGRDGMVLWNPRPAMGTELTKQRATEIAKQYKGEVRADYSKATIEEMQTGHLLRQAAGEDYNVPCAICPDCTEKADQILVGLKVALGL